MMENSNTKLWNKNFILIVIASTGISFASYFFLSTIPIYAERISGSTQWSGVMTGVFSFAALISRPITGYLVDRVKRSAVAFVGALVCLVACISYNYAGIIIVLIIIRSIHGFGFGMQTTAGNTMAIDMIPIERRVEGIGHYGLCMTFAAAVGPAIALPLISTQGGLLKLSLMAGSLVVVTLISLLLIKYQKPSDNKMDVQPSQHVPDNNSKGFIRKSIVPSVMVLALSIVMGAVISFIALYALNKGFDSIGFFFTCSAGGMIISRLFAGKVGDRYGLKMLMLPSLVLLLLSLLGITFAPTELIMILVGFPYGLALGSIMPAFNVTILNIFPDTRRGAANSLYFACIDIGVGSGSILWGWIAEVIGYRGVFIAATCVCALLLASFVIANKKMTAIG